MSVIMIVAAIVSWVACGVLAYGIAFAHFQREYPTIAEKLVAAYRHLAMSMALAGPFGLAATEEAMSTKRTKWTVVFPLAGKSGKYIAGQNGKVRWTYDPAEAEMLAGSDGIVVDADAFAKKPDEYLCTRAALKDAR